MGDRIFGMSRSGNKLDYPGNLLKALDYHNDTYLDEDQRL